MLFEALREDENDVVWRSDFEMGGGKMRVVWSWSCGLIVVLAWLVLC